MASSALIPERMDAFVDELQKVGGLSAIAGLGRFARGHIAGLGEGISRTGQLLIPGRAGRTLAEGWADFAPVHMEMSRLLRAARNEGKTYAEYAAEQGLRSDPLEEARRQYTRRAATADVVLPEARAARDEQTGWAARPTWLGGTGARSKVRKLEREAGQAYLGEQGQKLQDVYQDPKALAEELSRRGWTGTGATTRYLPVGEKSLMTGFGLGFLPGAVSSEDPMGTGRGRSERFGEHLGQNIGFVAGAPAGLIGGLAAGSLAGKGLGTLGKGVDWMGGSRTKEQQRLLEQQRQQMMMAQQRGEG